MLWTQNEQLCLSLVVPTLALLFCKRGNAFYMELVLRGCALYLVILRRSFLLESSQLKLESLNPIKTSTTTQRRKPDVLLSSA